LKADFQVPDTPLGKGGIAVVDVGDGTELALGAGVVDAAEGAAAETVDVGVDEESAPTTNAWAGPTLYQLPEVWRHAKAR